MYWLDAYEFERVVECFAENAIGEIRKLPPRKGIKEISDMYITLVKGIGNDAHFVGQTMISLDGDRVAGYWNVLVLFPNLFAGFRRGTSVNT